MAGGKRIGAGRPRHNPPLIPSRLHLTEDQRKLLRVIGRGDMSAGARWLIKRAGRYILRDGYDVTPLDQVIEIIKSTPPPTQPSP